MVYTRKRIFKKRTFKRRPATRTTRRATTTMITRRPSNQVHSFKRMLSSPFQFVGSAVYAPLVQSFTCTLGNLTSATDFTNLYDQYRINFVSVKFWLKIDPGAQTAAAASYPKFYWYRDYDDDGFPSNLNEMRENSKCKVIVMNPNRPITVAYKPNVLQTVYASTTTNTYKPAFNQWTDMANTSTKHYGFKWAIDDLTNTNYKVDLETTVYFQCRQPR